MNVLLKYYKTGDGWWKAGRAYHRKANQIVCGGWDWESILNCRMKKILSEEEVNKKNKSAIYKLLRSLENQLKSIEERLYEKYNLKILIRLISKLQA